MRIPKIKMPKKVTDYQPISLCNVVYKIASKAIANRLKKILPYIISDTHSAFVHGRLITDNILVAFQTMHYISQKKGGKVGEMALKLDISMAYDRVEWVCLDKIMDKLGFDVKCMQCVTTITYSIKINGMPRGNIIPSRGIRQGDPLSPYLFILCAEGLSAMMQASVTNKELQGVVVCRSGLKLSHLFFVDDSLIFCKVSILECNALQKILGVYESASGQQLNRVKTSLFFSKNTPMAIQEEIKQRFGAQVIKQYEKYLGLPSLVGKNKRNTFNEIKEKLHKKFAGWKEKMFSKARKEVLNKAVAQAIPTYTRSCFKLSDALCEELTSMTRNFWWGQQKEEKRIAWLSWEKLCVPKSWDGIMSAQHLVREGAWWRVGNGNSIRVWGDEWLPSFSTYKVASPRMFLHQDTKVNELIDQATGGWKKNVINALFMPFEAEVIKGIPLSSRLPLDKLIWVETPNGKFSVRSAYGVAMRLSKPEDKGANSDNSKMRLFWRTLWGVPLPHKVRHFAWRACKDVLPTKASLKKRNMVQDQTCDGCRAGAETTGRLFWSCPKAREVWSWSMLAVLPIRDSVQSFIELLWKLMVEDRVDEDKVAQVVCIAWTMWNNRNVIRIGRKGQTGREMVYWAQHYLEEYKATTACNDSKVTKVDTRGAWVPPPRNVFKVNVDAAVFAQQKAVGIGVIIRDDMGRLEAALSKRLDAPLGAVEAEAMAYKTRLLFAKDIGIQEVVIEGDSLIIHHALSDDSNPPISVSAIIQGMQELCEVFYKIEFSHVRRQGNKAAHLLAKHAIGVSDFIAWIEETPCFIEQALIHDLTNLFDL